MNDQVKQESVENTASQDNAGVNEVSNNQDVANKVFSADQLEQIVQRRLERYKKTVSNKLDGIDIEEAKKLLQEKKIHFCDQRKLAGAGPNGKNKNVIFTTT